MKKIILMSILLTVALVLVPGSYAAKPVQTDGVNETAWEAAGAGCSTITQGNVFYQPGRYLAGQPIPTGFDPYGYNYQGHLFKGSYANVYLNGNGFPPYEGDDAAYALRLADEGFITNPYALWYWPYRTYDLQMKWNDAWIANTDCDSDGLLDRHYGYPTYRGSGAWQTNQYGGDGWASLTKFSAVPSDAYRIGPSYTGIWYTADGVEIGTDIWGEFAITQDVLSGEGALYVSPAGPGYGQY